MPDVARIGRGFLVRGSLSVAFGVLVWVWPHATATTVEVLLGVVLLLAGASGLVNRFGPDRARRRSMLGPVVLLVLGGLVLGWPNVTGALAMAFVGVAAIALGFVTLLVGATLRRAAPALGLFAVLIGAVALGFGVLATVHPGRGATAVIWLIGLLAVALGAAQIVAGRWLRRHADQFELARTDITVVDVTAGRSAGRGGPPTTNDPRPRPRWPPALPPGS